MAKGKKRNKARTTVKNVENKVEKGVEELKNNIEKAEKKVTSKVQKAENKVSKAMPATPRERIETKVLLQKENLKWIGIGVAVLAIGYLLMIGGKSPDPNVFDEKKIYSFTRITLAPILVCIGFGLQMYGIMKGLPKSNK